MWNDNLWVNHPQHMMEARKEYKHLTEFDPAPMRPYQPKKVRQHKQTVLTRHKHPIPTILKL